jgi:4-amino-4-deoxy-L-arabinose transferase-like glycosyltransferase
MSRSGALPAPPARRTALLIALCFVVLFLGSWSRALWDIDEGMHAATSLDMVRTGDWVTPRVNGEPFYDKPPLFNWLVALSLVVFGANEFAARLPGVLLGLGVVLMTYGFGRRMIGDRGAFLGAVVLATSLAFIAISRAVVHDMALVFFVTVSTFALYRAWDAEENRTAYLLLAYVSAGFGILTKGPLAVLLPGAVMLIFLAIRRDLRFLLKMKLVLGAVVTLAVAVPWYALVAMGEDTFLGHFLLRQNVGNFLSATPRHPEPFWFYAEVLLVGFLPWSFFLPLAVTAAVRRPGGVGPARTFLLVWATFVFVFFSAASSKLPTYVLPMFPAAALLVGDLWDRAFSTQEAPRRWTMVLSWLPVAVLVLSGVAYLMILSVRHPEIRADLPSVHLYGIYAILLSGVMVSAFFLVRGRYRALFATMAGFVVAFVVFAVVVVFPWVDGYRSSKTIALRLDGLLPPGEEITSYGRRKDSALFYTDRRERILGTSSEVVGHLSRPGALCLTDDSRLEEIESAAGRADAYRIVDRYGNKVILEGVRRPQGTETTM